MWQICFSSKRKKIYLGVCMTGRVRGKEQGKRHASPRQIVRSDDLVSGSDDSGGGVRSDRAKILYWHWKASGNDGRSVAKKKDNNDIPTIIAAFGESYLILSKVALYR